MSFKKSQLQINETIIVIFIFILILLICLVIFNKYNTQSIKNEIQDNERLRVINMLNTFPNSPEIGCSTQTIPKQCIDLLKLTTYANQEKDLGAKDITINITYPKKQDILIYSNQPAKLNSVEIYSSPVSIYDPISDKYLLGVLEIKWYT